jgi:hypothetical protein
MIFFCIDLLIRLVFIKIMREFVAYFIKVFGCVICGLRIFIRMNAFQKGWRVVCEAVSF